jgi:hypothetical protein
MSEKTPGEVAFAQYLTAKGIAFEHEPRLSFTNKRIDFVVDHSTHGKIYFEVKDINCPPPAGRVGNVRSIRTDPQPHPRGEEEIQRLRRGTLCACFVCTAGKLRAHGASRHAGRDVWRLWMDVPG